MKVDSRSISRPYSQPPVQKEVAQIEQEFVETFLQRIEDTADISVRESSQKFRSSGLKPTTSAFLAALSVLPPTQALALAGTSFAESQPQLNHMTESRYVADREQLGTLQENVGLYSHPEVPAALTTGVGVYLNPALVPHLGSPWVDWIVGHELGHMESADNLTAIGRGFVIGQLKADQADGQFVDALEQHHHQLNRECEFESDQEGLTYALAQGHAKETIQASVKAFLSLEENGVGDTHPDPELRVAALEG